jgi:hypothetical protein
MEENSLKNELRFKLAGWLSIFYAIILIAAMFNPFAGLIKIVFSVFIFPYIFWKLKRLLNLRYNYFKADIDIVILIIVEVVSIFIIAIPFAFADYLKDFLLTLNSISALLIIIKGLMFLTIAIKLLSINISRYFCIDSCILGVVYTIYGMFSSIKILLVLQSLGKDIILVFARVILFMPTVFLGVLLVLIGHMYLKINISENTIPNEFIN